MDFRELAKELEIARPSVGRIVKREGIVATYGYCAESRKRIKVVSDSDAKFLIAKYKPNGKD